MGRRHLPRRGASREAAEAPLILALDTSAFVKLLVLEDGSQMVATAAEAADGLTASRLVYVEARGLIGRRRAERSLRPAELAEANAVLERWWTALQVIELGQAIGDSAADLAERHVLRGADAVHVATALWAARSSEVPVTFATWDARLRAAAKREGLRTLPA